MAVSLGLTFLVWSMVEERVLVENCHFFCCRNKGSNDIAAYKAFDVFILYTGCVKLCNELRDNYSVMTVDLKGNHIGAIGADAIADLLRKNPRIAQLCLEWNNLGDNVAKIADALRKENVSLKHVSHLYHSVYL